MSRLWLTVADEPLAAQECNVNTHFRYAQWWLNKLAEALVDGAGKQMKTKSCQLPAKKVLRGLQRSEAQVLLLS